MNVQTLPQIPQGVVRRHAVTHNISDDEALRRSKELERFLFACSRSVEPLVPSCIVDEIWHDFILHTKQYEGYCERYFGRLIHHTPHEGEGEELRRCYEATLLLMREQFGSMSREYWPATGALCDSGSCKGH